MTDRPPLRIRKAARTRTAIIDAATRLFEEKGFSGATLTEIADLAEVHKQTVLRYFSCKEEIALALRVKALERLRGELESSDRTTSVIDTWRAFVSRVSRVIMADPDQFRFNQTLLRDDKIVAQLLLIEYRYEQILATAFAREAGVDPKTDLHSKLLAGMLVSGNFMVGKVVFSDDRVEQMESACLEVVDFAKSRFPPRT